MFMQVQNINNIDFKGGFKVYNVTPNKKAMSEISRFVSRGKQIFNNFQNEGDVFVLTRPDLDRRLIPILNEHKLKFDYYPEMDTRLGLDSEIPEGLEAVLPRFKVNNERANSVAANYSVLKQLKKISHYPALYTANILKTLNLQGGNPSLLYGKGKVIIQNPDLNKKIIISKADKNFVHYVIEDELHSTSSYTPLRRYAIRSDGEKIGEYSHPDEILNFLRLFKQAKDS